jgi:hypothetical protein
MSARERHEDTHASSRALALHRLAADHEEAARGHESNAVAWEVAGDAHRAAVERLFADLERDAARLERKRAFLGLAGGPQNLNGDDATADSEA